MTNLNYLIVAALACLGFLSGVAGSNWFVDPDNLFGNNWTGIYVDNDRFAKKQLVRTFPHDALLIGSSKVATIDPGDLKGNRYFNASMVGVVPEEILSFLRDNTEGVRHVVLGLDFYMFNERESPIVDVEKSTPRGITDGFSYLFSFNILKASIASVFKRLTGTPPLVLKDGQRNPAPRIRADAIFDSPQYEKTLKFLSKSHYANFQYSQHRVSVLNNIKTLMADRGIRLTVFINPLNQEVLSLLKTKPAQSDFGRFRKDVAEVFPDVVDFSESRWSAPNNYYYSDPWHYRHTVGAAMINGLIN